MELFDYIEVFYNQRRRHSTLGQISPAAFERRAARRRDGRWGPRGRHDSRAVHDGHGPQRPPDYCLS